MGLWLTVRKTRDYLLGRRDGASFSKKHASLAYLNPVAFPKELKERYTRKCEGLVGGYERRRNRLESLLEGARQQRLLLERVVGVEEATPEVFGHIWTLWGRYNLLGLVFSAELVYNKLAMDALGLTQIEAWVVSMVATVAMFWMGHEAGNQFKKQNYPLAIPTLVIPLLLAIVLAALRAAFTRQQVEVLGLNLPTHLALPALLVLGVALVAFTFLLGYKSPTEREILLRRYFGLLRREKLLSRKLVGLHQNTERRLGLLHAAYREEVSAFWRGFARAWPAWDPAPASVGLVEPLQGPPLRPLEEVQVTVRSPTVRQ